MKEFRDRRITRRNLLRGVLAAGGMALLSACQNRPNQPPRQEVRGAPVLRPASRGEGLEVLRDWVIPESGEASLRIEPKYRDALWKIHHRLIPVECPSDPTLLLLFAISVDNEGYNLGASLNRENMLAPLAFWQQYSLQFGPGDNIVYTRWVEGRFVEQKLNNKDIVLTTPKKNSPLIKPGNLG